MVEVGVSLQYEIDPAAECIRYLTMNFTSKDGARDTVRDECRRLTERYSIPPELLDALTEPIRTMEAGFSEALDSRRDLWGEMFYPGSEDENLLAWGFFMLERQTKLRELPLLALRRQLVTAMLSLDYAEIANIETLDGLMAYLRTVDCSVQAKWICTQVWQEPISYYDRFRQMVDLAAPVVQRVAAQLVPDLEQSVSAAANRLEEEETHIWDGMDLPAAPDALVLVPLCIDFNGRGICCDETSPSLPAYQFVGVFSEQIQSLAAQYGNQAEYLAEQMKTVMDQSRLEILMALKSGPLCGQDLVERLGLTPGTISHHMSQLVRDGFVCVSKEGARVRYGLQRGKIKDLLARLQKALL